VDIRIPFTPGMAALIQAKLTPHAAVTSMTTGQRFGGGDAGEPRPGRRCRGRGHRDGRWVATLRPLGGKDADTLGAIKHTMFEPAVRALTADAGDSQPS
jgi:hypothetical protein